QVTEENLWLTSIPSGATSASRHSAASGWGRDLRRKTDYGGRGGRERECARTSQELAQHFITVVISLAFNKKKFRESSLLPRIGPSYRSVGHFARQNSPRRLPLLPLVWLEIPPWFVLATRARAVDEPPPAS